MGFKVANTFDLPNVDCGEALLETLDAEFVKGMWRSAAEIVEKAADADAVIGSASFQPFDRELLGSLTRCRIVASSGVGFNNADLDAATDLGIVITNVPDATVDEVSGRAIAFMFALNHRLFTLDKAVREKHVCFVLDRNAMAEFATPIFRMRDQTVGIIGLGKIGMATAVKARGLGMRVLAYDPYVFEGVMASHGVIRVDLDTLAREADYISVHTHLNEETANMIDERLLGLMKPTAHVINTARGGCVDEVALATALRQGRIGGAGLDVNVTEPIASDDALLALPNVILTGHSAGVSLSADLEVFSKPMTQVVTALRGEWPPYAVNPAVKSTWLAKWGKAQ